LRVGVPHGRPREVRKEGVDDLWTGIGKIPGLLDPAPALDGPGVTEAKVVQGGLSVGNPVPHVHWAALGRVGVVGVTADPSWKQTITQLQSRTGKLSKFPYLLRKGVPPTFGGLNHKLVILGIDSSGGS